MKALSHQADQSDENIVSDATVTEPDCGEGFVAEEVDQLGAADGI